MIILFLLHPRSPGGEKMIILELGGDALCRKRTEPLLVHFFRDKIVTKNLRSHILPLGTSIITRSQK